MQERKIRVIDNEVGPATRVPAVAGEEDTAVRITIWN
jgi:hypothetical protein